MVVIGFRHYLLLDDDENELEDLRPWKYLTICCDTQAGLFSLQPLFVLVTICLSNKLTQNTNSTLPAINNKHCRVFYFIDSKHSQFFFLTPSDQSQQLGWKIAKKFESLTNKRICIANTCKKRRSQNSNIRVNSAK